MLLAQTRPCQRAQEPQLTQEITTKEPFTKGVKALNILPVMCGKGEESHLCQQTNTDLVKRVKASLSCLLHNHTRLQGNRTQRWVFLDTGILPPSHLSSATNASLHHCQDTPELTLLLGKSVTGTISYVWPWRWKSMIRKTSLWNSCNVLLPVTWGNLNWNFTLSWIAFMEESNKMSF